MKQSVQVCIEKGCNINRIITNYEQICQHFSLNHEVWSIEKLEMKGNEKMKILNQQAQNKAVKDIEDYIYKIEENVQKEVKSLFENLKIHYVNLLTKKIKFEEKLDNITINNKQLIQKYVDVWNDINLQLNSTQLESFIKELESRIIYVQTDISKELQLLLDYSKSDIEVEITEKIEETLQAKVEEYQPKIQQKIEVQQPMNKPMQYEYKYYDEPEEYAIKDEDIQSQLQNIKYQPKQYEPKEEIVEKAQPLRGYKQQQQYTVQQPKEIFQPKQPPQQFQEKYIDNSKETNPFLRQQNHDRINFALPSDNGQTTYIDTRKGKPAQYDPADSPYSEKQEEKKSGPKQKISITGKKFDITNSDKHLKYGQRFSMFSCKQFGFAVVDGIFTLDDDAKVRFMFSDSNGDYDAQMGIIQTNFDRQNLRKDNQGKVFMDENGNIWKQDKKRSGSIKISLNCDYHLQYRAEKRLLMIRRAETAEYIHLDTDFQGTFRFFVALSNLQVQIK